MYVYLYAYMYGYAHVYIIMNTKIVTNLCFNIFVITIFVIHYAISIIIHNLLLCIIKIVSPLTQMIHKRQMILHF